MPKITELFAFVVADRDENDEGIMVFLSGDTWQPMVGANMKRIEALRPIADSVARQSGKPYKVMRFKAAEEIRLDGPPIPIEGIQFQIGGGRGLRMKRARRREMPRSAAGVVGDSPPPPTRGKKWNKNSVRNS